MRRLSWIVVLGAVALVVVSGCGDDAPDKQKAAGGKSNATLSPLPGGEPALDGSIVSAGDPKTASYPLRPFSPEASSLKVIKRASLISLEKCMAQFGFQPDQRWHDTDEADVTWRFRYGVWIAADAAERGYLPPESSEPVSPDMPYVTQEARSVMMGTPKTYAGKSVPEGGCAAEAKRAVFGTSTLPQDDMLAPKLDKEALARALQDSRVVKLTEKWRSCMKDAGFDFTAPMAPFDYWQNKRGEGKQMTISAEEKKAASTDVACKSSTKLLGTTIAADVAYQKYLVDRNIVALRASISMYDPYLERANRVIAGG